MKVSTIASNAARILTADSARSARSGRFAVLTTVALIYLLVSLALRFLLWWTFGRPTGSSSSHLPAIVVIGALNDLFALIYLLFPITLFTALVSDRFWRSSFHRLIYPLALFSVLFLLIYLSAVEFFFFDEFTSRFNLVAVDYLMYPTEVFGNIWSSYPVGRVVLIAAGMAAALAIPGWHVSRSALDGTTRGSTRALVLLTHVLMLAAVLSLPVDSMTPAGDRVERELELNGVSSFIRALRTHDIRYSDFYVTEPEPAAFQTIRSTLRSEGFPFASREPTNLSRVHPARPDGLGAMNVVVVVEESFGSNFIGASGARKRLTPNFDKLAREGLFFSETYATGTRTVRGLEAITVSFPPIPSESILKRPHSEGIATWASVMRAHGYHTSFLYGGYGTFDHMNQFYSSNGFEVMDRTSFDGETFGNIWGACDQDLFRNATRYFDERSATGTPFFSIIMTTSNHKPFTFPAGVPGVPPSGGGRAAGVRYADYALGEFLRNARSHSWFDRTLFVVIADHGARVYGSNEIPVPSYRIPFLIFAPAHLPPRRIEEPTSQMDVAPTVLGILGLAYTAPFYGRDALKRDHRPHDILLSHNHDVALYRDGRMAILGLNRTAKTYSVDRRTGLQMRMKDDPALTAAAVAYFETGAEEFTLGRYR